MKISILHSEILPAVTAVSRSVGNKATLPVLANILLSTENGKLKIAGTNLEIGVIKLISVKIEEEGSITVPAKTLTELLTSLNVVEITLETKQDILVVTADKFKSQMNGISATEFPIIPTSTDQTISFSREIIKDYSRIMFAASSDGGRPVLTGILTSAHGGNVDLVATDGFRLAHRHLSLPNQKSEFKTLIPRRTLEEVLRIIDEEVSDDQISISTSSSQNQIIFTIGLTTVSSRLIEGNFPNWEKIIPKDQTSRVIIDSTLLAQAVKLASVFAKNEANIVTFDLNENKLLVSSETKELGSQSNEIECQFEGEPLKISFSARFLSDVTSSVNSKSLMIELTTPLAPAKISPVGIEGLEYIVMPIRQS